VAAVVYRGKVCGIVPKTFIPNYNEFYDKRWFASSRELKQKQMDLFGEVVPAGIDLVFDTGNFRFAIEICEDLWTPIPPSSIHALHGAEIIFNLSASDETAGKSAYRRTLVAQQSARCVAGYVYAAAGNGESTTDIVFSGHSLIAENGEVLKENRRFSFESDLIATDIDIEKLRSDRLKDKSFTCTEYKMLDGVEYRSVKVSLGKPEKTWRLERFVNPMPFVPKQDNLLNERCDEIFSIQIGGLAKRLLHTGMKTAVVGVSGGLDSTLALLVVAKAFDKIGIPRENIYGITMPGFGTTNRTYQNALELIKALGVTLREISIVSSAEQHFKDIEHDLSVLDVVYENTQARERTQILMDYANKVNGLVIGTGDLSELALGWCTYNGDHMSMYAVNNGVPKTLVRTLVEWVADTQMDEQSKAVLVDVIDTPVSPELLPADENGDIAQRTEDVVGPYILHDFFLYYVLRFGFSPSKIYFLAKHAFSGEFSDEIILKWLKIFFRRFFSQQFKRSCLPDGPKVGSVNLSPRGDWRMPSDASLNLWQKELDGLVL
jgi:NAD+ synthase (glutamine-hydrolysing)